MSDAPIAHRRASRRQRTGFLRKWWFWTIVGVVVIVLCMGTWVGARALQAKSDLQAAVPLISQLKADVLAQNTTGAKKTFANVKSKVADAKSLTSDPIWRGSEIIPGLGANLAAVRELADVTNNVVVQAVQPLIEVASSVSMSSLKPVNGSIDLAPLVAAEPKIATATSAFNATLSEVRKISTTGTVSQIVSAKTTMQSMLEKVVPQLQQLQSIVQVLPGALGESGPRNYLLAFQNNGEVMALGGTIGSLAVLNVDKGHISLARQAGPLDFPLRTTPIIPLAPDVAKIWDQGLGKYMQNLTATPRFSLSFQIAQAMWQQRFGTKIDGLIVMDPVALSYILGATGPITLSDGTQLTSANAVQELLSTVYTKFTDPLAMDAYNASIAQQAFAQILGGHLDPKLLMTAILNASSERRLLVYSANPSEEKLLSASSFDAEPPVSTPTTDAFGVYFADHTPSKMGYYLQQSVDLAQAVCPADGLRHVRVTVTLTNTAPANAGRTLPAYVTGLSIYTKPGNMLLTSTVYAPPGYTVVAVSNGAKDFVPVYKGMSGLPVKIGSDGDYPVGQTPVYLAPTQSRTVTYDFVAKDLAQRTLTAQVSPVIAPTKVTESKLDCGVIGK
jgi:hypothetical protein